MEDICYVQFAIQAGRSPGFPLCQHIHILQSVVGCCQAPGPMSLFILDNVHEHLHLRQGKRKWVLGEKDTSYLEYGMFIAQLPFFKAVLHPGFREIK